MKRILPLLAVAGFLLYIESQPIQASGIGLPHHQIVPIAAYPEAGSDDPRIHEEYAKAINAYYSAYILECQRQSLHEEEARRVFEWQLSSSKASFGAVFIVLIAGLIFCTIQIVKGRRRHELPASTTEIELSAKGLKISSPALGVIIMTISLAFFYLYLVYVYPITIIDVQQEPATVSKEIPDLPRK